MMSVSKKEKSTKSIYNKNILTRKIHMNINEIGANLHENLEKKLVSMLEEKCASEGFIKKNSIRLITYSSGTIGHNNIEFNTSFECLICKPVEGMIVSNCVVKNNTKAGIRAELKDEIHSPLIIFVSRDHNYKNETFTKLNENDIIRVKIIGIRYELNDTSICAIAELVE
jgi:DNA-directed RNA polymerase subunit E'/Rpb7